MNIIDNNDSLRNFCTILSAQPFITIDLEFHREKTYYPQLGLIQVGCPETEAIIDPLAKDLDLSPFFEILKAPKITKVFHSCRQDIEIIYQISGIIPQPLFDTQIAAQVCGFGASASYASLVHQILGIELDKSCRLTNWCVRPLDPKQLIYAISDVTHLVRIYKFMRDCMAKHHREDWIEDEMAPLLSPATYTIDPYRVWEKMHPHSHNPKYLTILRELAAWREKRAQTKDIPRQTIIKDECLLNIATSCPHTIEELASIRNMRKDILNGKLAAEILEIIQIAEKLPCADFPSLPDKKHKYPEDLFELLRILLAINSQNRQVSPKIIATETELRFFASGQNKNIRFLQGWRYDIFGKDACLLRDGKLLLSYNPKTQKSCLTTITEETPQANPPTSASGD